MTADFNPLKPSLGVAAVPYIAHYLYCISRPGLGCGTSPVSTADQLIVSTTATRFVPPGNLTQFQGRTMHWTAAACNVEFGCTYQQQVMQIAFPFPGPVPLPPVLLSPAVNERVDTAKRDVTFTWKASLHADHYTVCVSLASVACGQRGSFEVTGITGVSTSLRLPTSLGGTGTTVNWTVAACNNVHTCRYQSEVRPLRIRAYAEETLDVLTYNIYMRP